MKKILIMVAFFIIGSPFFSKPVFATESENMNDLIQDIKIVNQGNERIAEVTLRDVLALALKRSLLLQDAMKGEESAEHTLKAIEESNMPILHSSIETGRNISQGLDFSALLGLTPPSFNALTATNSTTLMTSLSKKLSNGVRYGLTYAEVRAQSTSLKIPEVGDSAEKVSTSDPLEISSLIASVDIPIFQDWGAINNIQTLMGEVGVHQARLGTRLTQIQLVSTVATLYWNLVGLLENIKVQEDAVQLTEKLLTDNKARLQAGLLSKSDIQATETQLARQHQQLLTLKTSAARIEDTVRTALDLSSLDIRWRPTDIPRIQDLTFNESELLTRIMSNDTSLGMLKNSFQNAEYALMQVENRAKTNLDFSLAYTLNGYSDTMFGGVSGMTDQETNGFAAKLSWTVPLFDKSTPEQLAKSRLELERVRLKIQNRESELKIQLQSDIRSLKLAREQVQTAKTALDLANEQLQNVISLLKQGQVTSFQVSQAQQQAAVAGQQEIFSRVDYEKQYLNFLILTGDVFSFYHLDEFVQPISDSPDNE